MTLLAAFAFSGCLAVAPDADRIAGRDFAPLSPEFASAAGDLVLSLAPAPGAVRIFRAPELARLAARFHLEGAPLREICFERRSVTLTPERLLEAMRRQLPAASIEVVEFSKAAAPEGEPEFPLTGLHRNAAGEIWSGFVRYAGNRRFPIWAKVHVRISTVQVVAAQDLRASIILEASHLRLETVEAFPEPEHGLTSITEAEGRVVRRAVPAGTVLSPRWLATSPAIRRGDSVRVSVESGSARLEFEAEAETAGVEGQTVLLRNPVSRKRFPARVTGKGLATAGKGNG